MKLIIEIPEAKLIALQKGEKMGVGIGELERAVLSGTPTTEIESIKQELDTFIEEEICHNDELWGKHGAQVDCDTISDDLWIVKQKLEKMYEILGL